VVVSLNRQHAVLDQFLNQRLGLLLGQVIVRREEVISPAPPIRECNLIRIAIAFVTSFVIVFLLESAALAVIGWAR
jgi:hypothetical protein